MHPANERQCCIVTLSLMSRYIYKMIPVNNHKHVTANLCGAMAFRKCVQVARNGLQLHWRQNERIGVSDHQPHDCLLNCLFRRKSKKTSKLRVTGICAGNSPLTGEFPSQMASNAENVSIWWRHHVLTTLGMMPIFYIYFEIATAVFHWNADVVIWWHFHYSLHWNWQLTSSTISDGNFVKWHYRLPPMQCTFPDFSTP